MSDAQQDHPGKPAPCDIRQLEELALNAWPSLKQVLYDGWVLRFADGHTRRSNSVNPLYPGRPGHPDLAEKIRFCEAVYQSAGLPSMFKLTAASKAAELAGALAARGYREQGRTSVQVLNLDASPGHPAGGTAGSSATSRLWDRPAAPWLASISQFTGLDPARRNTLLAMLQAIAPPARFAAVTDGSPAAGLCACGLGVLQGEWIGLFDIATRPDRRRQGFGRQLMNRLLDWGRANGARTAYLQVMLDNPAALALYAGLGFREAYQYAYLAKG